MPVRGLSEPTNAFLSADARELMVYEKGSLARGQARGSRLLGVVKAQAAQQHHPSARVSFSPNLFCDTLTCSASASLRPTPPRCFSLSRLTTGIQRLCATMDNNGLTLTTMADRLFVIKRQNNDNGDNECCSYYGNDCYPCDSAWSDWVRWLVLAIIIIAAFLLFAAFSCITARRRRRIGAQPYRGTGWALGRTPPGHAPATYNANPHYQQPYYNNSNNPAPPPAYTPAPNQGYYGHDVELQQPQQAYGSGWRSGGEPVYEPPKGPPPAR